MSTYFTSTWRPSIRIIWGDHKKKFDDDKGLIKSPKYKDRQYNDQKIYWLIDWLIYLFVLNAVTIGLYNFSNSSAI
jgi:hypothetical protein